MTRVLSTQVIHETLAENTAKHEGDKNPEVRIRADEKVSENSKLESYRFCEETWTMELTDAEVQLPGIENPIKLPRAMIVAVQSAQSAPRCHAVPHELACPHPVPSRLPRLMLILLWVVHRSQRFLEAQTCPL